MAQPTSEKSKSTGTDIIYQDVQRLEGQYSGLATQVERLRKVIHYDEKEARVAEQKSGAELLSAVAANTELVNTLIERLDDHQQDPLGMAFHHAEKQRRQQEVKEYLKHIRILTTFRQEITPVCPCGKHQGIRFVDANGKVVEERCPVTWWVSQSRLAYEDHNLSSFLTSTPLDKYIAPYRLKN